MDSKGNIYEVDEKTKTKLNLDTGKSEPITSLDGMTELPPDKVAMLKAMNRKDRRAWLAQYKKELSKLKAKGGGDPKPKRVRKSTMVELVEELEKLLAMPAIGQRERDGLTVMIAEAKAGEFHDYKNEKYACGKVASSSMLRELGFVPLAKRIEEGEFDEEADETDKANMKRDALAGGFNEEQCKKLFDL